VGSPEGARFVKGWRPVPLLAATWLTLTAAQTARLVVTGSLMSGDGVYHFAHLHSIVVDRDLDAGNEIRHFQQVARSRYTGRPKIGDYPTRHPVTREPINKYPVGLALFALPAYAVVYGAASMLTSLGVAADTSGYGAAYQWSAGVLLAGWYVIGLWCAYKVAAFTGVREQSGWWATALAAAATPWLFYATLEPFFAHALSASVAAAMLWLWLCAREQDGSARWWLTGVAAGVAGLIRYQDLSLLVVPAGDLLLGTAGAPRRLRHMAGLISGCALGFLPQLAVNAAVFGNPFTTGYANEGFLYWQSPWIGYSLFAADVGLLRWSPIVLLATLGLAIASRRGWPHARWGLALLALQLYLVSSWYFYSQGHSFGNRMLVNCTPVIAIGLAGLLTSLDPRPRARAAVLAIGIGLVAVNLLWMALWATGRIGPLSGAPYS
jgi:hypothetical protein